MKAITGKKAIVSGHSMGNIQIYASLLDFSQKFKDDHIQNYFSILAPFGGSNRVVRNFMGMSDEHSYGSILVGYLTYHSIFIEQTVPYDLFPSDVFSDQQYEPWMRNITNQINYESAHHPLQNTTARHLPEKGISFWPDVSLNCSQNLQTSGECSTGLYNISDLAIVRIGGDDFYLKEAWKLIIENKYIDNTEQMIDLIYNNEKLQR
jgi:hypothetical protein